MTRDGAAQIAGQQDRAKDRRARKQVQQCTADFDNPQDKNELLGISQMLETLEGLR